MIGVLLIVAALVGITFAAIECFRTWGTGAAAGVAVGGLFLTFVIPYGVIAAAVGSVVVTQRARTRRFMMLANGDLEDEDEVLDVLKLADKEVTTTGYKALAATLRIGDTLADISMMVSGHPHEALRDDGLWPGGRPAKLYRVTTEDQVSSQGGRAFAENWQIAEVLNINTPLAKITEDLVDFEDELINEQLLWRQALERNGDDSAAVEAHLREAMKARGLKHWKLERSMSSSRLRLTPNHPPAAYTWGIHAAAKAWDGWEAEADEDEAYLDALKTAWRLWHRRDLWNSDEAFSDGMDDVATEVLDAWTALLVFYAAEQGWVELPSPSFTTGIRDAYHNGLALVKPTHRGVLTWAMK